MVMTYNVLEVHCWHTFASVALVTQAPHEVSAKVAPRQANVVVNLGGREGGREGGRYSSGIVY